MFESGSEVSDGEGGGMVKAGPDGRNSLRGSHGKTASVPFRMRIKLTFSYVGAI